jgi:hypothetical protein
MFQEAIANLTAEHLRLHIEAYLELINAQFPDDLVKLVVPKSIETASAVGGQINEFDRILPAYGVDVWGKVESVTIDNLNTYDYAGQISGLVSANSRATVDRLVKRHAAAVEYFLRQHERLHEVSTDDFLVLGLFFVQSEFSGAEYLGELKNREIWIAGFSMDTIWTTSEASGMQHAG